MTVRIRDRIHIIVPPPLRGEVDDFRRDEPDLPNLSEACRRLMEKGLKVTKEARAA